MNDMTKGMEILMISLHRRKVSLRDIVRLGLYETRGSMLVSLL